MDRHELAWAAGFFDGDGWVGRARNRAVFQPVAQVNQAGDSGVPVVLDRLRDALGVGSIRGPAPSRGRFNLYSWTVSSRGDVTYVEELLWPWLSEKRRTQFIGALGQENGPSASIPVDGSWSAWASGFFDAEGSVSLLPHRSHSGYFIGEASVTQGSPGGRPQTLLRFTESVGGVGQIYGPYVQAGAKLQVFRWKVYRLHDLELVSAALCDRLSPVKRDKFEHVNDVLRSQPALPRGNPAWGSHKTHCINGHEYAAVRMRRYVSRGGSRTQRDSRQCLACVREAARARRWRIDPRDGDAENA